MKLLFGPVKKKMDRQTSEMYSDDDNDSRYTVASDTEEEEERFEEESIPEEEFEEEYEGQLYFLEQEDEYFSEEDCQKETTTSSVSFAKVPLSTRTWNFSKKEEAVVSMADIFAEQTIEKRKEEERKEQEDIRRKKRAARPTFNFSDNSKNPRFFKPTKGKRQYYNPKTNQT